MIHQLGILYDINRFADSVMRVTNDHSLDSFENDETVRSAVCYLLLCLGEAAGRLERDTPGWLTENVSAEIPWRSVIGLRHVLAHDYAGVRYDQLWRVVGTDVPAVSMATKAVLAPWLDIDGNLKDLP